MNILKLIGTGIAGVVVGLLLAGATQSNLGGVYSITEQTFDDVVVNDDVTIGDDLTITDRLTMGGSTGTTTLVLNKACIQLISATGNSFYAYFRLNGTLATTSSSGCID